MQFIDLKTQYKQLQEKIDKNIKKVLDHSQFIMGAEVKILEEKLAEYIEVKHCITVSSGTDALLAALMALNIKKGDQVITTPFSFIATAESIILTGAEPVFTDINPLTYNIEPNLIEKAITSETKALMPVSLYGQCADMDAINNIAAKYNIPIIEDAAQSFGAEYKNKKSCGLTLIGCTSFFPSKPLGCYGDGGACFTNDDTIAKKLKEIRDHGQNGRYNHIRIGINGRLDTLQAAILLAKLETFDTEVKAREQIGARYTRLLNNIKAITAPHIQPHNKSVYAQYTIQIDNRDSFAEKLKQKNIPTAVHYPIPLNMQPAIDQTNKKFPIAETVAKRVISLPMHPFLSKKEQDIIVNAIIEAIS
ncbi:MAG: DegT/DnrJ/EryC1/StrS family aminotransferase [Deltaproteobacteria bacterium]|nr:DegT/DnrJ/EryC1/StrS family aminotransferase [Deltaproteobacteria bacterium]